MELNSQMRKISQIKEIYSGNCEQQIELDYVLPDYYPDIFKIIKCVMCPCISNVNANGGRISFNGETAIKVFYQTADDNTVRCIEQNYNYSKNVECDYTGEISALVTPKADYSVCRAVNERRISIRGTVNNQVIAKAVNVSDILTDADGLGVQLKKKEFDTLDDIISINKHLNYTEEINLSESKESVEGIYCINTCMCGVEYKIIANKIIVKAKCNVNITYQTDNTFKTKNEQIQMSHILDANGITDEHECKLLMKVNSCGYELCGEENAVIDLTLNMLVMCEAYVKQKITVCEDAYSTEYNIEQSKQTVSVYEMPCDISEDKAVTTQVKIDDIASVETVIVKTEDMPCVFKNGRISGAVNVLVIGKDANGTVVSGEKNSVFEHELTGQCSTVDVCIKSQSFTISADGTVEVRTDLEIKGYSQSQEEIQVIDSVVIGEKKQDKDKCGIIVYYPECGESVWEIAKRYNSSASAIIEENSLEKDEISERTALLIPTVF